MRIAGEVFWPAVWASAQLSRWDALLCRGGASTRGLAGLLLTGDGALGTLAGAGVRLGALTANGKAATVTQTLVASAVSYTHLTLPTIYSV